MLPLDRRLDIGCGLTIFACTTPRVDDDDDVPVACFTLHAKLLMRHAAMRNGESRRSARGDCLLGIQYCTTDVARDLTAGALLVPVGT